MNQLKQLIKEFRELRSKATQGRMTGYITLNKKTQKRVRCTMVWNPPECPNENIVHQEWKVTGFSHEYWQDVYFYAYSMNNITKLLDAVEILVEGLSDIEDASTDALARRSAKEYLQLAEEKVKK